MTPGGGGCGKRFFERSNPSPNSGSESGAIFSAHLSAFSAPQRTYPSFALCGRTLTLRCQNALSGRAASTPEHLPHLALTGSIFLPISPRPPSPYMSAPYPLRPIGPHCLAKTHPLVLLTSTANYSRAQHRLPNAREPLRKSAGAPLRAYPLGDFPDAAPLRKPCR